MTVHLDAAKTLDLLRKTVEKYGPDTTYAERFKAITGHEKGEREVCLNVLGGQDGKPVGACIVGTLLADLVGVENVPFTGAASSTLYTMQEKGVLTYDHAAEDLLASAQARQDDGAPWGIAVRMVD